MMPLTIQMFHFNECYLSLSHFLRISYMIPMIPSFPLVSFHFHLSVSFHTIPSQILKFISSPIITIVSYIHIQTHTHTIYLVFCVAYIYVCVFMANHMESDKPPRRLVTMEKQLSLFLTSFIALI